METKDYLAYVVKQIHTTIVATVDDEGLPVTAAIDMMDSDDDSLYFLTAKDHRLRLILFAVLNMGWNLFYAVFNGILGIAYRSGWFGAMSK